MQDRHFQELMCANFQSKWTTLSFLGKFPNSMWYFGSNNVDGFTESYNTSRKFCDQSLSPHYQCCFQVSETVSWNKLRCCYSANILQYWVEGKGLIYFCKVDHSRISKYFSRNWVGLNNLYEILSQNLRKLGK